MYISNPISAWGKGLTTEKMYFSLETYTGWNTNDTLNDIGLLNSIVDKGKISNEDIALFKNIVDKYNCDVDHVSVEALSAMAIGGITVAIVALIGIIAMLIKQLTNNVNSFAGSNDAKLEHVVKTRPVIKPANINNTTVKETIKNNPTVKVSEVNTIVKTQANVPKPPIQPKAPSVRPTPPPKPELQSSVPDDQWARETSNVAKAYLSYLDLLGIDKSSKTLKDMGDWMTLIKSNNGDMLKMLSKILPTTTTITSDRVTKQLGLITSNRSYDRYSQILSLLLTWSDEYEGFLEYGGYDSDLRNLVNSARHIDEEVAKLTSYSGMMFSSNTAIVDLGYENLRDILTKKKALKDFNGPFAADISSLELNKYSETKIKEHITKLSNQLNDNSQYGKILVQSLGKSVNEWEQYLVKFIPNTVKTMMSEYNKDVLALKVVTDFITNSAAIVDLLNSNTTE